MGYNDIYEENQGKYEISNRTIFSKLLAEFKKNTGLNIDHLTRAYAIDTSDSAKEFMFLKWVIFTYQQKYISYFYELLDSLGYDMFSEVIDTMKLIGKDSKETISPDVIEYALISPYIDGITIHKSHAGLVTIHSEELGDYDFYPSRLYLQDNANALGLINDYLTAGFCHQISWHMMNHHDKCELITSLLPSYFEGTHYHTVVKLDSGMIIDSANEAVYDETTRDYLFKGKDICKTDKEDLNKRLEEAKEAEDEASKIIDFPDAMLLTLHEQTKRL